MLTGRELEEYEYEDLFDNLIKLIVYTWLHICLAFSKSFSVLGFFYLVHIKTAASPCCLFVEELTATSRMCIKNNYTQNFPFLIAPGSTH